MMKEEASSTGYVCMQANNVVPINGIRKPKNNTGFAEAVNHQSGRNRHDSIGNEERSRDESRHCQVTQIEVMNNVRNERPRILVINDMVNQNAMISASIPKFFFILFCV